MKERDDLWHDASIWLMNNHCTFCKKCLRCEIECSNCDRLNNSLSEAYHEIKKETLQEILDFFDKVRLDEDEYSDGIRTCMDFVKKKLKVCI